MRYVALLALAACAPAAAPLPQSCPPSTPPPLAVPSGQLSVEEATHDVGEILRGETVSHTFKLTNTSGSDVTLLEVRVCCTCVTAAMTIAEKHMTTEETKACKLLGTLKPKEHASLVLTLDTLDDGCGSKDGPTSKSVRVYFSDRASSPLTLSIAGSITTPFTLEPTRLNFGTVKQGQGANASCMVIGTRLGDFKVTRVRPLGDSFKASVERVSVVPATSNAFRVTAEILPNAPTGNYQGQVVVDLDHPRVRAIVIPLSVVVEAAPRDGRPPP